MGNCLVEVAIMAEAALKTEFGEIFHFLSPGAIGNISLERVGNSRA